MIDAIECHRAELAELCRRFSVRRLDLFGSAATATRTSAPGDADFLVEFESPAVAGYADRYFGLREALEQLCGLPIDLVVATAIRNPYFRESVEKTRVLLYAA